MTLKHLKVDLELRSSSWKRIHKDRILEMTARVICHQFQVKKLEDHLSPNSRNLNFSYLTLRKTFLILITSDAPAIIYVKGNALR